MNWYVVLELGRDPTGKRRQKWLGGFRTRREAEAARARALSELNQGTHVLPTSVTLGEWLQERWLPQQRTRVKASTFHSYRRNLELHVVPRLGSTRLQSLHPRQLEGMYAELLVNGRKGGEGGLSARTVAYVHRIIHNALESAVRSGVVRTNVAGRARAPRAGAMDSVARTWTAAEVARFLESVEGDHLAAAWRLAAMTGMRRGELLGLRWQDVDLERSRLVVRQTRIAVGYEVTESTPKTHRPRTVDLDPETTKALRRHRARQIGDESDAATGRAEDLVVRREDGSPIHPHSFSRAFDRLVMRSGLPRIRLHDLRHSHASLALSAGIPVKVVSERLGHASPSFTLAQYAHALPGMQRAAAEEVAQIVRSAGDGRPLS